MASIFISDLHLDESRPDLTQHFHDFLARYRSQMETLYILGDLFELWIGDDAMTEFHLHIASALKSLSSSGVPIYFMPGNRDFLIGTKFCKLAGCTRLPDPSLINLYGENVLLTHGDLLCIQDKAHLRFRRFTQCGLIQKLFLCLPLSLRQSLAKQLRTRSQTHMKTLPAKAMDAAMPAIEALFNRYREAKTTVLIHGHTHQPNIHYLLQSSPFKTRYVLSDWGKQFHLLLCDASGKKLFYET